MLYLSERRLRPSSPASKAHFGHAISRHSEQRENPFDRRELRQDSTFASRKDLVLAVEEALHDARGQIELAALNTHSQKSCAINIQLSVTLGKIKANVVQSPMAKVGNKFVPSQGPQKYLHHVLASSVFVLVDKHLSAESWAPLHIQTAFPRNIVS